MTQIPKDNALSWLAIIISLACVFGFTGKLS